MSKQVLRFGLYELFEDDRVGVFDLVELLGLPVAPTREASRLVGHDDADLVPMSLAALVSLAGYLKLLEGSERLDAAAEALQAAGWTVEFGEDPMAGPTFASLPGEDISRLWGEAIQTLRVPFLWAVVDTTARHLLEDGFVRGCWDLHSRPDGVKAKDGRLPTIDASELLDELRGRPRSEGRGIPVLRVLPTLRDRLSVVLDLGLSLSAEEAVSAMCVEDPEAGELDGPSDDASRKRGVNNHRIVLFRARERIEDALLQGHGPLSSLLKGARQAPLPSDYVQLLRDWASRVSPPEREQRRVMTMARLAWLSGRDGSRDVLAALLEGSPSEPKALRAALVEGEPFLWRTIAEAGLVPPPPWTLLGRAGDSVSTTMVLLRYVTPVRTEERPGLETLGEALTRGPTGREAGVRAASRLEAARGRLMKHLEATSDPSLRPPSSRPPTDLRRDAEPETDADELPDHAAAFLGDGLWPSSWLGTRSEGGAALWRGQLRGGVEQVRQARRPVQKLRREAMRQLRGIQSGLSSAVAQARWWMSSLQGPQLGLASAGVLGDDAARVGGRISLSVRAADGAALRPWVVREAAGQTATLFPADPTDWAALSEFRVGSDGAPIIDIVVAPPAGLHRYVVALVPEDSAVPTSAAACEAWVRAAVEDGRVQASAIEVDIAEA
jgi:hypothetical protein